MPGFLLFSGFDPSAYAGCCQDLLTLRSLGIHPWVVPSFLTIQDERTYSDKAEGISDIPSGYLDRVVDFVGASELDIETIKIGALSSIECIDTAIRAIKMSSARRVVVDPVITTSTGKNFIDSVTLEYYIDKLLPLVDVVTPNVYELSFLGRFGQVQYNDWVWSQFEALLEVVPYIVLTGLRNTELEQIARQFSSFELHTAEHEKLRYRLRSWDILITLERQVGFERSQIECQNSHGTGCIFSSALAGFLHLGDDILSATEKAGREVVLELRQREPSK